MLFRTLYSFIVFFLTSLTSSCCGPFTEAVRLSDPGVHQTLHRSQLATEARQGSLSQRPSWEGGQGNNSILDIQLRAEYDYLSDHQH